MASTVNMAQGYEHKRFKPPSLANMHNAIQYQLEVPTARNRAFVKRWMTMFPQDPYIGEMAQNTYFTIHLYAKAARIAGTTDQERMKKALELGWSIEAPEGSVSSSPGRTTAPTTFALLSATRTTTSSSYAIGRASRPGGCSGSASTWSAIPSTSNTRRTRIRISRCS